jgi:hypothetical protein
MFVLQEAVAWAGWDNTSKGAYWATEKGRAARGVGDPFGPLSFLASKAAGTGKPGPPRASRNPPALMGLPGIG